MATEEQKRELQEKVTALVDSKFGGDWTRAFNHYSTRNGIASLVEKADMLELLEDAGVGSWISRGAWADGIIKELDLGHDNRISWDEFQKGLSTH